MEDKIKKIRRAMWLANKYDCSTVDCETCTYDDCLFNLRLKISAEHL